MCVCVCVSVCLCICVCVSVCLCKVLVPPNNFHTSYPIDTKFRLHIVSYRNSQTPLSLFLNFENCAREKFFKFIFSLVYASSQKNKTYKMGLGMCVCVCVCVCLCACACVCVQFWSRPNNFHTSYAIDTKFWLHIVSYWNSPMQLIPFLNFENCDREKFLKLIFSPFN